MINRFTTMFYPRKDKVTKTGVAPIYMRVTINGVRADYSLKIKIPIEKWDKDKECAKGSSGEALRVNQEIQIIANKIHEIKYRYQMDGRELTTKALMTLLDNPTNTSRTLKEVVKLQYERVLNLSEISFSKATATRYNTILRHLDEFIPLFYKKDDVLLCELDFTFAENYTTYLRSVRKCNHNSTMKYMKMLKAVIHYAQKSKLITDDPFKDFECPIEKTETVFLTKGELHSLESKDLSIERLRIIRDIFIFACYTGLSYVDIAELKPENIKKYNEHYLVKGRRQKTNEQYTAYVSPKCEEILKTYENHPLSNVKGLLFPVPSNQITT